MALMFQSPELNSLDQRSDVSLMHKVREGFKVSFRKGWSQGKSFATLGILFSSTECIMEKYRGKHDVWNSLLGGWIGGAAIAWRGGPVAIMSSMALMTGFSLVLDLGLGMRGYRPSPLFTGE
jgi:mitochondrial import inner membrane translocase subunit TIM22